MTRDRQRTRRNEKDPGHTVIGGPSLLQSLEKDMMKHTRHFLKLRDAPDHGPADLFYVERGVVRGLAMAIARIRLPYEDQADVVRRVETEFVQKAKAEFARKAKR